MFFSDLSKQQQANTERSKRAREETKSCAHSFNIAVKLNSDSETEKKEKHFCMFSVYNTKTADRRERNKQKKIKCINKKVYNEKLSNKTAKYPYKYKHSH